MPAIITHHLFGEDASALLPEGTLVGAEDLLAFLLGNQGPDPLWARTRTTPWHALACHTLASHMHEGRMTDAFFSLRDGVSALSEDDKSVGRAFVLGLAGHYLLDSMTHPLLYAQEHELICVDPTLKASRSEIHALMEAEIDSWTLWQMRQKTVLDSPCEGSLACTHRIGRVAGTLLSHVATEVYGIKVPASEYAGAIRDYRLYYKLIDPPAQRTARIMARMERIVRPHSHLQAQAHPIVSEDYCASANLEHRVWRNPVTGDTSNASFPDLFHDALIAWPVFSLRLMEGDRDRFDAMIGGINYNGFPKN